MAEGSNRLALQFTDEVYATKSEVSQRLNIGYVDQIWNNILSYRMVNNRYLSQLRLVDGTPLVVCLCPGITKKVEDVEANAVRALNRIGRLSSNPSQAHAYRNVAFFNCLKEINNVSHFGIDDNTLKNIVSGSLGSSNDSNITQLINYYSALRYLESFPISHIDEDLLAELYSRLTGNHELTSFYREEDDVNRVVINKIYDSVPHASIEPMMEGLFNFINDQETSCFIKLLTTSFYVRFVKPFPTLSSEISILLMKALLISEYGNGAVLINLEMFLSNNNDTLKKMFNEVQTTRDVTYYINAALPLLSSIFTSTVDKITEFESDELKKDFYGEENEVSLEAEKIKEETPKDELPPIIETPAAENPIVYSESISTEEVFISDQVKIEPPIEQEVKVESPKEEIVIEEKKEEPKPIETPKPTESPRVEPAPTTSSESVAYNPQSQHIASYLPPALDEREAQRLEEHLLELDPTMHRKEAAFYARHCTLGKKYTIAQCKKYLGCAYETARKTMERLVELGYYRREMVKNKSVYAPIPRNE